MGRSELEMIMILASSFGRYSIIFLLSLFFREGEISRSTWITEYEKKPDGKKEEKVKKSD